MARLRLAVIGVGHLGKEHARILAGLPEVELVGVADANGEQAQAVARRLSCTAYGHYQPLLPQVDAAVIAVPTVYHHAIAMDFLRCGIPLLVEKPLASTLAQAESLVEAARKHHALLQVGHIERFNPALEELQRHSFQPKFIGCERLSSFTGRSVDIGVVLDLMIHDLDVLLALVQAPVHSVEALGVSIFGGHEDVANARVTFANGCVANITASRASSVPQRRMHIWSPEGYASLDFAKRRLTFIQPAEEIRERGLDPRQLDPASLAVLKNELFGRYLHVLDRDCNTGGDPLTLELQHFVDCVQTGAMPRVSGEAGRDAIALAARILDGIARHPWDGRTNGPKGPGEVPAPLGAFFQPAAADLAA
jgi:predicted dehydrogenase